MFASKLIRLPRGGWTACLALVLILTGPGHVQAQGDSSIEAEDGLSKLLGTFAQDIDKFLSREELARNSVIVGHITGPSIPPTTSGPAIEQALREQMKKLKIVAGNNPQLEIRGDYTASKDRKTGQAALLLKLRLVERDTLKERATFPIRALAGLNDQAVVDKAKTLGPTVQVSAPPARAKTATQGTTGGETTTATTPAPQTKGNRDPLLGAIENPKVVLKGPRVEASKTSPYAVEILVAPVPKAGTAPAQQAYAPRPAEDRKGLAFVPLKPGECYAIGLFNDSDFDAAVTLTIDGLNLYTFSDERDPRTNEPAFSKVLIRKHSSAIVYGWYRTGDKADTFLVNEYSESPEGKLLVNENPIGTITAIFRAAWPVNEQPPPDESPRSRSTHVRTVRGPSIDVKYDPAELRFTGKIRDIISVRYDKPEPVPVKIAPKGEKPSAGKAAPKTEKKPPADLPPGETPPPEKTKKSAEGVTPPPAAT